MLTLIFTSVLAAAASGLVVKYVLDRLRHTTAEITWQEFGIGLALIACVISPLVTKIGWEMVRNDSVTFNEYWNGWELSTVRKDIVCARDGSCLYEYDCDPYIVMVTYSCGDAKHPRMCTRAETRYHECPYVSNEFTYVVKTSLGDYTIDANRFPIEPQKHRWRSDVRIPQSVIDRAGVGEPRLWTDAYERTRSGRPGPVTTRREYSNYVLASDTTLFRQYSSDIDRYLKAGLLPKVQTSVHDFYFADKVYFVGYRPTDFEEWRRKISYLNAALGTELQGDLHMVVVQNESVSNDPDTYARALRAYWLNKELLGRDALAKNGICVIVGTTDGATVSWARSFTGMPIGNEKLEVTIRSELPKTTLSAESIIGSLQGAFKNPTNVVPIHSTGLVESVLWGLKDHDTRFKRYSMGGKDDKDGYGAGYLYLWGEIEPNPREKMWIWITVFFCTSIVWTVCAFVGENLRKRELEWNEI